MNLLTIYHTNDMHNCRPALASLLSVKKTDSTLILDAGDAIAGSSTAFRLREPIIEMMNRVGYDAMAMGNREFNYIRGVIGMRARQANFPILSANVVDLKGGCDGFFKPFIIKNVAGIRFGIMGLTPVQYGDDSFWLPIFKFRFLEPFKAACENVAKMREAGADLIILLSHLGLERDKNLAGVVKGIDFIIGGHTHDLLDSYVKIGNTYIFQAGSHGKYFGRIDLFGDEEGEKPFSRLEYKITAVEV